MVQLTEDWADCMADAGYADLSRLDRSDEGALRDA